MPLGTLQRGAERYNACQQPRLHPTPIVRSGLLFLGKNIYIDMGKIELSKQNRDFYEKIGVEICSARIFEYWRIHNSIQETAEEFNISEKAVNSHLNQVSHKLYHYVHKVLSDLSDVQNNAQKLAKMIANRDVIIKNIPDITKKLLEEDIYDRLLVKHYNGT